MFSLKLPIVFGFKPGLLISDDEVAVVHWRSGSLEQVALFPNDEQGVHQFADHLAKNRSRYRNKGFFILTNVIGEDYRYEKVAHLFGKYRSDFHNRRMGQLFRGSTLCMSDVQGREERGRREDLVLFFGVLTASKVDPWINAITRDGDRYLTGVHGMAYAIAHLRSELPKTSDNAIIVTLHENSTMRLTFFVQGRLRFSRLSKAPISDAAGFATALKKELERTLQYLHTMRVSVKGKLTVDCVCPAELVSQLVETLKSGDRLTFRFHDANVMASKVGVKKPLVMTGRDSSMQLHSLCNHIVFSQLAPSRHVNYHWLNIAAKLAMVAFVVYGTFVYAGAGQIASEGYFTYAAENDKIEKQSRELKLNYDRELAALGTPPSSAANMQSVSGTFNALSSIDTSPTRLLFYFANGLAKNRNVEIKNVEWFLSNNENPQGNASSIRGSEVVNGRDLYQVVEVYGELSPVEGETQAQVVERVQKLLESFEKRGDVLIDPVDVPVLDSESRKLTGVLQAGRRVQTVSKRDFTIRIIWRQYDSDSLKKFSEGA